ncbi:hypothetical protein [Streptomyces violascens]|uniref:hypothetical protein n=1 Tax=Streptomyces violascens TaxID=67381 RepID=UPI0036851B44
MRDQQYQAGEDVAKDRLGGDAQDHAGQRTADQRFLPRHPDQAECAEDHQCIAGQQAYHAQRGGPVVSEPPGQQLHQVVGGAAHGDQRTRQEDPRADAGDHPGRHRLAAVRIAEQSAEVERHDEPAEGERRGDDGPPGADHPAPAQVVSSSGAACGFVVVVHRWAPRGVNVAEQSTHAPGAGSSAPFRRLSGRSASRVPQAVA